MKVLRVLKTTVDSCPFCQKPHEVDTILVEESCIYYGEKKTFTQEYQYCKNKDRYWPNETQMWAIDGRAKRLFAPQTKLSRKE